MDSVVKRKLTLRYHLAMDSGPGNYVLEVLVTEAKHPTVKYREVNGWYETARNIENSTLFIAIYVDLKSGKLD